VLTEKISRRGYHLTREYDVDPLELIFVEEVMCASPATLRPTDVLPAPAKLLASSIPRLGTHRKVPDGIRHPVQRLFPVLGSHGDLLGVATRRQLIDGTEGKVSDAMITSPLVVHQDDTLRTVANLFAERHITTAPVVDRHNAAVLGLITIDQLLDGRLKDLAEEHDRERPLRWKRER
jgi:CBS domain-containing protein